MPRRRTTRPDPEASLRGELQRLGVAEAEAGPLADQLVQLAEQLPEREYRALVEGVVLGTRASAIRTDEAPEMQNLLEDFSAELKKLDEGLKLLMAYISRLRDRTDVETPQVLH